MMPTDPVFVAYAVVLLSLWWKVGISFVISIIIFGAVPAILAICWYSEALAPFTGLISKKTADEEKHKVRREERETFRQLQLQEGGESMEWLNFLIEQMWPKIAKYAEDIIRSFEERIQSMVPVPGGISFKTCSLGQEPIRFGPVKPKITSAYYDDQFIEHGGVELQIGLTYHSDVEIVLATKFATVGVAALDITGTLSVSMRPLVGSAPFFGGLEVVFTNPPMVDLDFKGIGNVADMPGIYSTVRNIIDEAIAGVMVTPHRIAKSITDDPKVDLARLKCPTPDGVLRIKVLKANSLAAKDFNLIRQPTSDPYVRIKIGTETWKTPTIKKTCNPEWTEDNVHDFVIYSLEQCAQIDVFDWDRIGSDDPLGSINQISVHDLIKKAGKGPEAWSLSPRSDRDEFPPQDARLHLEVEWLWLNQPTADQKSTLPGPSKYVLALKIDEATGLPESGLFAPFTVKMTIKGTDMSRQSSPGWSKWASTATTKTLQNIRRLHTKCDSSVIADVVDVDVDLINEFLRDDAGRARTGMDRKEAKHDQEWLTKLQENCNLRESSCNPQFEEVLTQCLASKDVTAVVELINDPKKRPKKGEAANGVVARFEVKVGDDEVIHGPFILLDPKTNKPLSGGASLHGTFTLWQLERSSKLTKVRAVARTVGLAAKARGKQSEIADQLGSSSSSPGQGGTPMRKRDRFMAGINKVFSFGKDSRQSLSSSPVGGIAGQVSSAAASIGMSVPSLKKSRVEEAIEIIQSGSTQMDVLCGLGMLRGLRDWEQARHAYRRKYGGGERQPAVKGGGDLVTALEINLPEEADRQRAAHLLRVNGIGLGSWPPGGNSSNNKEDAAECAGQSLLRACM
mmetsp:Transcript_7342/g.18398  ORF Transcript_7342/g.18398 Transcript_7342/m.18398 type:complete len:852 (-) Transcript_7342:45-2600(-)